MEVGKLGHDDDDDDGISLVVKSEQLTTNMSNPHNKLEKGNGILFINGACDLHGPFLLSHTHFDRPGETNTRKDAKKKSTHWRDR